MRQRSPRRVAKRKSVYDPWVTALLEGVAGDKVIEAMRKHYTDKNGNLNDCVLKTKVSDVKKRFLMATPEHNQRNTHKSYTGKKREDAEQRLRSLAAKSKDTSCASSVEAFLNLNLFEQAKDLKKRETRSDVGRKSLCDVSDAKVKAAFDKLQILPPNLETFRIAPHERETCKKIFSSRLLEKKTIEIKTGAFLERAGSILTDVATSNPNMLIAALLLVSGRRTAEILNG